MGIRSVIKKGLSFGFSPQRWVGLDQVKTNGKTCVRLVTDFVDCSAKENVAQIKSADLTLAEKESRRKVAVMLSVCYSMAALLLLAYGLYLLIKTSYIIPGCFTLVLVLLVASYLLRELMVYAQLRLNLSRVPFRKLFAYLFTGFPL